jgi:hypothetical protein
MADLRSNFKGIPRRPQARLFLTDDLQACHDFLVVERDRMVTLANVRLQNYRRRKERPEFARQWYGYTDAIEFFRGDARRPNCARGTGGVVTP